MCIEPDEAQLLDDAGNQLGTAKQITDRLYLGGLPELAGPAIIFS
jgi:hypothetical protein